MTATHVKCPTCQRDVTWDTAEFRPFCSERCRLIDLGAWFTERHVIPGENTANDTPAAPRRPQPDGDNDA
jgi:uncharacterized protein